MKGLREAPTRGEILTFLREIYPEGAERRTILSVLYQYHDYEPIKQALEYLVDKGYVTRKDVPHPYRNSDTISIYRISPKGIDLLDGLVQDPAVLIPRGE